MPKTTRELIEAAFADVPYPGDDNIADHQDCPECDDVRAFFRGKSWRELRFPELHAFHGSLPLFMPQAFRYFLPGYMLATLSDWRQADMIPYSVIGIGGYPDEADGILKERREERLALFTPPQREAITAYLRELSIHGSDELRGDDDIEFAIKRILGEKSE